MRKPHLPRSIRAAVVLVAAVAPLALSLQVALADVTVARYQVAPQPPAASSVGLEGITTGPDGNLWFLEAATNKVGVMSPAGTLLHEYPVGSFRSPELDLHTIITGPDGNLWFTEGDGSTGPRSTGPDCTNRFLGCGRIDRMSPTGELLNRYDIPLEGVCKCAEPEDLTVGPDGNIWFTDSAGSRLGYITIATGAFQMYDSTLGSDVKGITVGPDKNLWFTAGDSNKIGRMTTSGQVKTFTTPGGTQEPIFGITTGPDGALYFGESGAVGRITVDGVLSHFDYAPGGNTSCEIRSVVSGPGGFIYFTAVDCNMVGRMSLDGTFKNYDLNTVPVTSVEPFLMTTGPDGSIWFTSSNLNYVGSLVRSTSQLGLTSSKNPSNFGDAVTFTATITIPAGDKDVPSGKVKFLDGTAELFTADLTGTSGQVVFRTSALSAGTHSITAVYSGDASFTAATSPVVNQVVIAPAAVAPAATAQPVPRLPKAGSGPAVNPGPGGGQPLLPLAAGGLLAGGIVAAGRRRGRKGSVR
ncbi:MAG: hypothetical protein NVSMB17_13580 [Candidatus Dormibacteria bacterium]